MASAKGSHHGITDATWTYLARRIVFAASQYMLQRYAARKRRSNKRRAKLLIDEPGPRERSRWGVLGHWLRGVFRRSVEERVLSGRG